MATNRAALNPVTTHGWRMGFSNVFRKENGEWWRTRTLLRQAIAWLLIMNGILALMLWSGQGTPENLTDSQQEALAAIRDEPLYERGLNGFLIIGGLAFALGITIRGQGVILDEKKAGTLAWLLSKPVSRTSVYLAKWLAQAVFVSVVIIGLQALIAYVQLSASKGAPLPPVEYLLATAMLILYGLFYLSLTLMLGVISDNRGAVIGIPLLVNLGYQFIVGIAQGFAHLLPYELVLPMGETSPSLAYALATEQPLPSLLPIATTILCIIVFSAVAIWRFRKLEF